MRIGIDIRNIGKKRTGDEVVFLNLVKNLAAIDKINQYFLFTDVIDADIISNIKVSLKIDQNENFKVVSLKSKNKFIWNIWTLPKYLRSNPVDIFQIQYIVPFFISRRIKIITVVHDISFNFFSKLIKFSDLVFLKLLMPLSLQRADKILAVSQFTRNEIIKFYKIKPEKIDWVYNAVSDNFLNLSADEEISDEKLKEVRIKYGLPEKFILYLGTMQPRKNLPFLIKAFAEVKEKIPEMKLVLAGGKNFYNFDKDIDKSIKTNNLKDDVIFTGFVSEQDKPLVYKSAWAFCFPSLYEGFGIPILEAMAMGVPVIVSKIKPHEEITGNNALFFDPEDVTDLEEKLMKICLEKGLREELKEKGKNQLSKFSWLKSAEKLLRIYSKLYDNF